MERLCTTRLGITRQWLLLAALLSLAAPATASISVAILPESQTVTPGSEFDVEVAITELGSSFNAFGLVIGFDPAALTPIPISPLSDQIGGAMTEVCSNFFHDFRAGAMSDTVNCSMLCGGVTISGPGQVYRLRFQASLIEQVTELSFQAQKFYRGGVFVSPVSSAGAVVQIVTQAGSDNRSSAGQLSVWTRPNPASRATRVHYEIPIADRVTLDILDIQGRQVRRIMDEFQDAGRHSIFFDGRTESGSRVPAGMYVVRLVGSGSIQTSTFVILP